MHRVIRHLWDLPDGRFARDDRVFALTFDDGPGPFTPGVTEALANADTRATFFPIGSLIAEAPETIQQLAADGHSIGGHSWSHTRIDKLADDEVTAEYERTAASLHEVTGNKHNLIRSPYGFDDERLAKLLGPRGFTAIKWSVDPRDWEQLSAVELVTSVVMNLHPGAIVVLHDGGADRCATVDAIPLIVAGARLMGYEPVAL